MTVKLIELYASLATTCGVLTVVTAAHLPVWMCPAGCWPLQYLLNLGRHS
jgi:hypothetical protein